VAGNREQRKTAAGKAAKGLEIARRRREVALLLRSGLTQQEVAGALGVSEGTVSGDVKVLKEELWREGLLDVEGMVREELAALAADEVALRSGMFDEEKGGKVRLYVYDRVLAVLNRRAQLAGLDSVLRRKQAEMEREGSGLEALLVQVLGEGDVRESGDGEGEPSGV
jgi:hypothetical protein